MQRQARDKQMQNDRYGSVEEDIQGSGWKVKDHVINKFLEINSIDLRINIADCNVRGQVLLPIDQGLLKSFFIFPPSSSSCPVSYIR